MNIPTLRVPVIHDKKTAGWTLVTIAGAGIFYIVVYWGKNRIKVNGSIRIKNNETDNKIRYLKAKTECKMKVKAASQASEVKDDPATVQSIEQDDNVSSSEVIDHRPLSSEELFNRTSCGDNSKWIVDGYMKVGLVNLLGAGASIGKSTFMTQIALSVVKGKKLDFLPEKGSPSVKLPVIYYRLEDFAGELEGKYGDGKVFVESGIQWYLPEHLRQKNLKGFVEHLQHLASTLTEDTLVCIDPATKLGGYNHSGFIKGVEEAMAIAKSKEFVLTIIASIHLDEIRDSKRLYNGDIKGGDKAIQQAGSVTALRKERTGEDYCFLQCLKAPKGSDKPFHDQVLVCKKAKNLDDGTPFLHYKYDSIKPEEEALPPKSKDQTVQAPSPSEAVKKYPNQKITFEMEKEIEQMLSQGKSVKAIAKTFNVSLKTIRRHKKKSKV